MFFCAAGLIFKEALAAFFLERSVEHYFPGVDLRLEGIKLGWRSGSISCSLSSKGSSAVVPWQASGLRLDADYDLWAGRDFVRQVRLYVETIDVRDGQARRIQIRLEKNLGAREFHAYVQAALFSQGKKTLHDIRAEFIMDDRDIRCPHLEAKVAGGTATMTGLIRYREKGMPLHLDVVLKEIRLDEVISAMEAEKKIDASGLFSGPLKILVVSGKLQHLEGQLVSSAGGRFYIKDTSMLNEPSLGGPAANIVIENLKNYYYDIGKVLVGQEGRDIKLRILLEGPAGQRDLEIFWHRSEHETS